MTLPLRLAGEPSPLAGATHVDDGLPPPIAFDAAAAGSPVLPRAISDSYSGEVVDLGDGAPPWLTFTLRSIRPVCVGALMAIPTVGAATVGLVALVSPLRAMAMVAASTAFLNGIPAEVLVLIGTLATGYGLAKTVERIRGARV